MRRHWSWFFAPVSSYWRCCGGIDARLVCFLRHWLVSRLLQMVGRLINHMFMAHGCFIAVCKSCGFRLRVFCKFSGCFCGRWFVVSRLTIHSSRHRFAARLNSGVMCVWKRYRFLTSRSRYARMQVFCKHCVSCAAEHCSWVLSLRQVPGAVAETLILVMFRSAAFRKFQKVQGFHCVLQFVGAVAATLVMGFCGNSLLLALSRWH